MQTVEGLFSSITSGKVVLNYEAISPVELSKCLKENDFIPTRLVGANLTKPLRIYYTTVLATIYCVVNNSMEVYYINPPETFDLYEQLLLLSLERKSKVTHETISGKLTFKDFTTGGTVSVYKSELEPGFFEKYLANNVNNYKGF